jgi:hypothetical protein
VVVACSRPSLARCSGSSTPFRRHCYEVVGEAKNFADAIEDCHQRAPEGGRLVSVSGQGFVEIMVPGDLLNNLYSFFIV